HHPLPPSQGLPPPQPIQHPRQSGLIHQHRPSPPHSSQPGNPPPQGPYISPHSSTPAFTQQQQQQQQHQSPYVGSISSAGPHSAEQSYYGAHPSPYSSNSAAGSYASSEQLEHMATQAAISRPYPSTYQTPQSSSPSSVHSPQHDQHGRPWYGQSMTHMPHQMYYSQYPMAQSSPYGQQHHSATSNSSVTSAPSLISSYQQQLQSSQHPSSHPQPPGMNTSPRMKIEQSPMQHRAPASLGPPHGLPVPQQGAGLHGMPPPGPGANPNAAPGPIPATTPLVVRQDSSGVQWIAFEYSRDRVKMEYTIRCDVESVNVEELSQEFKSENCVYPRACCGKDQYKGNRLHYESECNAVGWALAQLNSSLRGKRGLIQRAVDSWRNSNQDPRLRSRRVRRMAKINTRKATAAQQAGGGVLPGPSAPTSASMAGPGGSHVGAPRHPTMMIPAQPMHHHSANPDGNAPPGNQDVSGMFHQA
ncbi:hypothetical protein LTR66_015279, partial [Elasticomyces elasticus]